MKHIYTLVIVLALLCFAGTYSENDNITINEVDYRLDAVGDRALITGPYEGIIVKAGDCGDIGPYEFCVESVNYSPVTFYPDEYEIEIDWELLCDNCTPLGEECEEDKKCLGTCVHNVCQPEDPWCGDGFCDENETCELDCVEEVEEELVNETILMNETNTTENVSMNLTEENMTLNDSVELNSTNESIADVEIESSEPVEPQAGTTDGIPQETTAETVEDITNYADSLAQPTGSRDKLLWAGVAIVVFMIIALFAAIIFKKRSHL